MACISARNQSVSPAETQRFSSAAIWRASVSKEAVASTRGLISLLNESAGAVALLVLLAAAAGAGIVPADFAADRGGCGCRVPGSVACLRGGLAAGAAAVASASGKRGAFDVIRRPALGRIDSDRRGGLLLHRRGGDVGDAGGFPSLDVFRPPGVHVGWLSPFFDARGAAPPNPQAPGPSPP